LSRRSGVFAFAIMITILFASAVRADSGRPDLPAPVDEVLWWLPDDTEMVMVARGPFNGADLDPRGAGTKDPMNTFRLFTTLGLALPIRKPNLGDREVALAVAGARRFRCGDATTGMIIPYDGAEIVLFRDDLGPLGDALLAPREGNKSRREIIAGHRVLVEEIEHPDPDVKHPERHFLARPRPKVLIYATDRTYLEAVLERMAKRAKTRAIPADLPEWKHVDPSDRTWCVRHYDPKNGAADPTSPLARMNPASVAVPLDEQAIGLVVTLPPERPAVLRLTYLRGEGKVPDGYQRFWRRAGYEKISAIRQDRPGIVEVSLSLTSWGDPQIRAGVMFLVLTALGHLAII
jgi:hypothetical protein